MNQKLPVPPKAKSIDEVLSHLDDIIQQSIAGQNYLCLFAHVYRETTSAVKAAILEERFEDGARMEKMDVLFANLYIEAYYKYQSRENISSSWKYAFDSRLERLAIIQHILLGMNAHINQDLAIAAAFVAPGDQIVLLKNDFMIINQILADLTNVMQKSLGKISILMKLLDLAGFRKDEKIINFSIRKARDFAWLNAMELALLKNDLQDSRKSEIDLRVLEISKLIKRPPGKFLSFLLKVISIFEIKNPAKMIRKMKL